MRYLLLLVLLAGCGGKSITSLAEAHRAAATAKLAKIAALAPLVAQQPLLIEDKWQLADGLKLYFTPFEELIHKDGSRSPRPSYNTAIVNEHQLAKPSAGEVLNWEHSSDSFRLFGVDRSDEWFLNPAAVLETGKETNGIEAHLENFEKGLSWLERTHFVLVLRLRTRQKPGLIMEELKAREMKTFTGGQIAGDAVLYDVEAGTCLGGIAIDVHSDEKVEVRNKDVHGQLASKLQENAVEQIRAKVGKVGEQPR